MPSITGQPAIDVAVGLFFAFFLLSVLCSAINETIATALAWRSQTLLAALRGMLADDGPLPSRTEQSGDQATAAAAGAGQPATATAASGGPGGSAAGAVAAQQPTSADSSDKTLLTRLLDHPLIRAQTDETAKNAVRRVVPSYLPSRSFALALLDTISPATASATGAKPHDWLAEATTTIAEIENPQVKRTLTTLLADARGDLDRFRDGIERWFDATMDRASGWYKRKTLLATWVIAAIVTLVLNADAGQIATALWKDDVLRASVAAQAQTAAQKGNIADVTKTTSGSSSDQTSLSQAVSDVKALKLPLGWSLDTKDPRWVKSYAGFVGKLIGLALTTAALTLGAPFWFDLLGRVSRLRGTGKPERLGAA